jgi:hypothetical protein
VYFWQAKLNMTTKQFYLLCLLGVTLIGAVVLLFLWSQIKKKYSENKGMLFIALAMMSWALVAAYKFYDPPVPELINAINDRILSAFSNLFLIASLPYFPNLFSSVKQKYSFFRDPNQWVINVFVFFAIITIGFTVIDRSVEGDLGKKIIVAIDSIISTTTVGLVSFAIYHAITQYWNSKGLKLMLVFFFMILAATQIILPLIAIFPEIFRPFYYHALIMLLLGLVFFNYVNIAYFASFYVELLEIERQEKPVDKEEFVIQQIEVGYDSVRKVYFIRLTVTDTSKKNTHVHEIEVAKLLRPFTNWITFAVAKKHNIKLGHVDMATTKFRMVELWNKSSSFTLTQNHLFFNDRGSFEFKLDGNAVLILGLDTLKSKFMIRENLLQHQESFEKAFGVDASAISSSQKLKHQDELLAQLFEGAKTDE